MFKCTLSSSKPPFEELYPHFIAVAFSSEGFGNLVANQSCELILRETRLVIRWPLLDAEAETSILWPPDAKN